jgi:hypothetical protein
VFFGRGFSVLTCLRDLHYHLPDGSGELKAAEEEEAPEDGILGDLLAYLVYARDDEQVQ